MTIKSKLVLSSAITIVGLVVVVSLSIYAIGSIRTGIASLTSTSTPLQIRTTELQKAIEGMSSNLMQLGVASDPQEVQRLSAAVEHEKESVERISLEIGRLDAANAELADGLDRHGLEGPPAFPSRGRGARSRPAA